MIRKNQLVDLPQVNDLMHQIYDVERNYIDRIFQPRLNVIHFLYESMLSEKEFMSILTLGESLGAKRLYFCHDSALHDDSDNICHINLDSCSFEEFDKEWQREAWWSFEVLLFFDLPGLGLFLNNDLNLLTFGTEDITLLDQFSLEQASYGKDQLFNHLKEYLNNNRLDQLNHLFES